MITLENLDNALKNVYLSIIQDRLNNIDPFIASVEKTSKYIYGAEINIPTMVIEENNHNYYLFKQNLATITMPLYFSDKAISSCRTNANAFVEMVNQEVEDGIDFVSKAIRGAICDEDNVLDPIICKIRNHTPLVLNGFKVLFEDPTYCNVNKKGFQIEPTTIKIKELDFDYLRQFVENEKYKINFMICSHYIKRKFEEYEMLNYGNINVIELVNGYKCLGFTDNIIMQIYEYLPDNVIYFLNSDDFKIHELCDWQWLENDEGKIVSKVAGKEMYRATLVKYANLVCHKPEKQVKVVIDK